MPENKTVETDLNVSDLIERLNSDEQKMDSAYLMNLMTEITGQPPKMWGPSIIGFGKVRYEYESGRTGVMPAISFSPRKENLAIYFYDGLDKYSPQLEKLGKHKRGKGCLYIRHLGQVNLDILRTMIITSVTEAFE